MLRRLAPRRLAMALLVAASAVSASCIVEPETIPGVQSFDVRVSAVNCAEPPAAPNALRPSGAYYPFNMPQPPPPPPSMPESEMSLKDIGKRAAMLAEREAILQMLQRTAWNKRKAATKLRISYKALLYKIKESGIIDPRAAAEL